MRSHTTERFRKALEALPAQVQRQAKKAFEKWERDPYHPSLRFKNIHSDKTIYSVRISLDYRALGVREKGQMIWFWIGSHVDYEKLISHLQ